MLRLNASHKIHSSTILCAVVALTVIGFALPSAGADPITATYAFEHPNVSVIEIDGVQYHRVVIPDCSNGGHAGQPALPARGARILIPMGVEITNITILPGQRISLGTGFNVEPLSRPVPLSKPEEAAPPVPDAAIYSAPDLFPASQFEPAGLHAFRGYQILVLKLQPVQYLPTTGELIYYTDLTVVVDTVDAANVSPLYRGLPADRREVAAKIDNPELLAAYPVPVEPRRGGFDLLIITTPTLAGAFQPLKDYHDSHGTATEIRTTADIGGNQPLNVRNYIIDRYLNDGIEYVIIGGDDDVIPCRDLYVDGINDMPGDIYFSCLDGSWNNDNDSNWGEPNDGPGGGDVDLIAEVFVGRASVGDATEAARFVNKTLWYLNGQHSCTQNVLLVGEYLGFGGIAEYGGNYIDELVGGSSEHGYTTVGFDTEIFNIQRLYERDGAWSKADLENRINNTGVHILNHLGHGDVDYAMKLYNSDILSDIHNDDLIFVYSQTCLAGHLDGADCWAEHMNIKIDDGAFAVIMNARYGYGEFNSTDGPSQRFNREFWDAIFSERLGQLGQANADSKEDNIWRINDDYMRWCHYEINLFGDPTIFMRGACADAGEITLDSPKYACEDVAEIKVSDCGLNTDDGVVDTVIVAIDSDSETGVEQVTLQETAPASAQFEGTVALSATNAPGVLLVAEGDAITATYIDADNGQGGTNITVTAAAVVDCTPPEISNVYLIEIGPRSATVVFDANEIVRGTVHYGTSCANLNNEASGGFGNPAMVGLSGLQDQHIYFFNVEAFDEAGNSILDDNNGECYTFETPDIPNFFTELFASGNDLDNVTLFFTPNGTVDFYAGCAEDITALPTDPAGSTSITMSDDDYEQINLTGGQTVQLYGQSYSAVFIGSNGYVTFGAGDTDYSETLEDHFDLPRVSAVFDDLYPPSGGTISYKQLADRFVVNWINVPEITSLVLNTFQIELYFNGDIRVSYLTVNVSDGLAGLSRGNGVDPDFYMSDLSGLGSCGPRPPSAFNGSATGPAHQDLTITLHAEDDGLPEPARLDYLIDTLPAHGTLFDPATLDAIDAVPYTLLDEGNQVIYQPTGWYMGGDSFRFLANDGGAAPEGGDSNVATVSITITEPEPEPQILFPLDSDPGWTREGLWQFGAPVAGGTHNYDPGYAHTGGNVFGYRIGGDYTNNMPVRALTTTAIDCGDLLLTELHFWYWLGVERSPYDNATVEISANGTDWTVLWANPAVTVADHEWSEMVFDVSAIADGQPTVYVRWTMGPTDGGTTYPGWSLDDVAIWGVNTAEACPGDLDGDNDVDLTDLARLLANYGITGGAAYEDGDLDGDGDVDLTDLAALLAVYGTSC